ncbi:MAG: rhomboid family intramembrane serine protease [Staphylococcus sp.]|nr:rhomboid family intramembrane serine protease [Staphylococcus sp.]
MVQEKISKTATLIISAVVIALSFLHITEWHTVGVYTGCAISQRVSYHFFHASLIHAVINAWCLLSIVFLFNVKPWRLCLAFAIATLIPDICLSSTPTVGLSVVCYALLGSVTFLTRRRLLFIGSIATFILIGYFFNSVNASSHLFGFISGLFVGLLTTPFSCLKK